MTMPALVVIGGQGETQYKNKINANFAALESFVNALQAQVVAGGVDGQLLLLDVFDRPGLVGPQSYQFDLVAYAGGSMIKCGRRPAAVVGLGEFDTSVAFVQAGGSRVRVECAGDTTLDAAVITSSLPKTIYVGIPSNGVPQLFEDTSSINVLYAWSMTWDGFSLSEFKLMAPILAHHETLKAVVGSPRMLHVFDNETNWVDDPEGFTVIVLPGASDDNDIGVEGAMEVLGFFAHAVRADAQGYYAPAGSGEDLKVYFDVESEGIAWTETPFEFDCSSIPDYQFRPVDAGVGDDKYVSTVRPFRLMRTTLGAQVVSARCIEWGVIVRPILGLPVPKDESRVQVL
jgi:hypothetical protein